MSAVDDPQPIPHLPEAARGWQAAITSAAGRGEHLAHDPRDSLMNQVFAVSLDLHAALALIGDDEVAERIRRAIDGLDRIINDFRDVVFSSGGAGPYRHLGGRAPAGM